MRLETTTVTIYFFSFNDKRRRRRFFSGSTFPRGRFKGPRTKVQITVPTVRCSRKTQWTRKLSLRILSFLASVRCFQTNRYPGDWFQFRKKENTLEATKSLRVRYESESCSMDGDRSYINFFSSPETFHCSPRILTLVKFHVAKTVGITSYRRFEYHLIFYETVFAKYSSH